MRITAGSFTSAISSVHPPIVSLRRNWSDAWVPAPDFFPLSASAHTGGDDLDTCTLQRKYGRVKVVYDTAFQTLAAGDFRDWWVKLEQIAGKGVVPIWIGRISSDPREVHGDDVSPSGVQNFTAYGPMQELRKIDLGGSYWYKDAASQMLLRRFADMNPVEGAWQIGNRSDLKFDFNSPGGDPVNGSYLFGDLNLWTRFEALEYIVRQFIDQRHVGGPSWSIGGQVEVLQGTSDTIKFDGVITAAQMVRRIIDPRLGMDFVIRHIPHVPSPNDTGGSGGGDFEIFVFTLSSEDISFGSVTLPGNPNTEFIHTRADEIDKITMVQTGDHRYSKVRVYGGRIVVCCSIAGLSLNAPSGMLGLSRLENKWSDNLQAAYLAGTGGGPLATPEAHDAARLDPRLGPVFGLFGAVADWDHNQGTASPQTELDGTVSVSPGAFQNSDRRTLRWTPLLEGVDYQSGGAQPNLPAGHVADFLPPAVYLFGTPPVEEGEQGPPAERWFLAEEAGIGVGVPRKDWGVTLRSKPNHLLAKGHFTGAAETQTPPIYDWEEMVVTFAFEADHRFVMGADLPIGPDDTDPGGIKIIEVPEAQLWFMATDTVVGVNADGTLNITGSPTILRNDAARLEMALAGAISRYLRQRNRAEITVKGLFPWSNMLGTIILFLQAGENDLVNIDAPITKVSWDFVNAKTTIKTGFAR